MNTSYIRKDKQPYETIEYIKEILRNNHIDTIIKKTYKATEQIYSIRLELKGFDNLGTNGKGITEEIALASAYAELVERLQSGFLIRERFAQKKSIKLKYERGTIDEIRNILLLMTNDEHLILTISNLCNNNQKFCEGTRATELISNKERWIPLRIINMLTHSNGLCAGNTPQEAIVQGICELLERYCMRTILFTKKKLKTIEYSNSMIEELEDKGFKCIIKDCSLDKYPVVGVLLLSKVEQKYLFTLGADPDFEIAVQRCLTELFQGNDHYSINKKMKSIPSVNEQMTQNDEASNWLKIFSSNNGVLPYNSFYSSETIGIPNVFLNNSDTETCYKYLLIILKNQNTNVFAVDYNILGFPTYKIFIPSLSEVEWLSDYEIVCKENEDKLAHILFSKHSSTKDINYFVDCFIPLIETGKYHLVSPSNYFQTEHVVSSDLDKLPFPALIAIWALKGKNKGLAIEICESEMKSKLNNPRLKKSYGDLLNAIKNNEIISVSLPTCRHCILCPCKNNCHYKEWKRIARIIFS